MKKTTNLILLILIFAFSFSACAKADVPFSTNSETEPPKVESSQVASADMESEIETESSVESLPQQQIQKRPVSATPPNWKDAGKTVSVEGDLLQEKYNSIIAELQKILDGYSHNISLAVYGVDGSKALYYNTEAEIFGACTVKAAYTLYACKQMELGNGNLEVPLTYQEKHFEPGTGDMQYSPFGTVFTMETALHKSMSISDNVGYLMAVDYFGREGYNSYISQLGCPSLQINPTVWSLRTKAQDLVKVWCEIYNYFATNTKYSQFLYNSCTNTAGNYATASLEGVDYSHKQGHENTGDWLSLSDAGIVWKGDTPYIIAILTDAPGPSTYSANTFAKITNIVHNKLF